MSNRARMILDATVWLTSTAFLALLLVTEAHAAPPTKTDAAATWREECGSCHLAFPPQLLPASSWGAVMDGLDRHFGVDASLAPAPLAQVRGYLVTHAARGEVGAAPGSAPRITTSSWFRHEHDEVAADVWRRPAVRSASNCGACHAGAAQGNFDEDGVRIPR